MVGGLDRHARYEIVEAIREAEKHTRGEIRVHVKDRCGDDALAAAKKMFLKLRMQRTNERNGVLILVAPKVRRFAIVGDAALHEKVGEKFWNEECELMQRYFEKNDLVGGIKAAVSGVGDKLKQYFPAEEHNPNELSDRVSGG